MIARYYQELLNHFTRMIQDRDSAADIVQEAYARVLAQRTDTIAQPRALLYHTARNLVIDRHRRSAVRGEHGFDTDEGLAGLAAPAAYEPDTALASSQAVDALLRAIDDLPPRCREAFVLHRFDGLSHAQVAERMGISRKTVEQHIKRAMDACRRCKAELDGKGRTSTLPRAIAAAACLVLTVVGGLAGLLLWQPVATFVHVTAHNERIDATLADMSRLQLASDSRAQVSFYRTRREIDLARGLARFEIKGDPGRPLTVQAGELRVTVVGTRFTVQRTGDSVRVAVEEGRVRVARAGWFTSRSVDLAAGQAVDADANGTLGAVSALRAADLAPWHERRTSFADATLAEVLAAFGRYGETGLTVTDPKVAALRVTGTFDLLRPDRFAQLLPQALPVRLVRTGQRTDIRAR